MARRTFELVFATSRDAIVDDFDADALAEWNPEVCGEGAENLVEDLPFAWAARTPRYEVALETTPLGEALQVVVTVTAGLLTVGAAARRQQACFAELRRRVEARAG